MGVNMKDYPNREALRKAHDIYRDAMRSFIIRCLKKVRGAKIEGLIVDFLDDQRSEQFEQDLQQNNRNIEATIEATIDIRDFPHIIKKYWNYDRAFSREFDLNSRVQSKTDTIVESRNLWAHPGIEDVDPEHTQANLTYVAEVLREIRDPDATREVEDIRDQLFSNEVEEQPSEVENAAYEAQIADMDVQLAEAKAEKTKLEEQLQETRNKLAKMEGVEAEWVEMDERLKTTLSENIELKKCLSEWENRLKTVESQSAERIRSLSDQLIDKEKTVSTFSDQLEKAKLEMDKLEKRRKSRASRFQTANTVKAELEERLETTSKWIEHEVTKLRNLFNASESKKPSTQSSRTRYGRTSLPTGKAMEQPVLEFLSDREEYPRVEIIDFLTEHFTLTDDERRYLSKTGKMEKYLMNRGLIERVRQGYYRITVDGLEALGRDTTDEDSVLSNEVYTESQSDSESPAKPPKSQRKWRRPGAVAALRNPTEIREAEAKIVRILNPSEKSRLERELREAKRAVDGS